MTECASCLARRGTICSALPDAELTGLFALATTETAAAGQWLVEPGDAASTVFILRSGHAHVSRITRDGKRQILAFLFPGDFFGFTYEPQYVYGAYADSAVVICRIARADFDQYVATHAQLDRRIRVQLTRLLDSAQELIFTLGRKSALERVAAFIWYLHYRQSKLGEGSEVAVAAIPMSRADIADFLGLTSESVSRAMTQLRNDGLIQLPSPDHAVILDMQRLREIGVVIAEPGPESPGDRPALR